MANDFGAIFHIGDGWVFIFFGIVFAAVETYRTSRYAPRVVREANKHLGSEPKIWLPISLVAIGVLMLLVERGK
jgi:hypothetical protein